MLDFGLSRRTLLRYTLGVLSAEQLRALQHAHEAVKSGTARLEYFDADTAREVESIASAIIPTDDKPGAKEAGVIYFIDRALITFDKDKRELYRTGLAGMQAKRQSMFPDSKSIAALSDDQRNALLTSIEDTEFFEIVRVHAITGFLAGPEWGGNRDRVGWKLIGLEDAGVYQPPFGYYDAQVHNK